MSGGDADARSWMVPVVIAFDYAPLKEKSSKSCEFETPGASDLLSYISSRCVGANCGIAVGLISSRPPSQLKKNPI